MHQLQNLENQICPMSYKEMCKHARENQSKQWTKMKSRFFFFLLPVFPSDQFHCPIEHLPWRILIRIQNETQTLYFFKRTLKQGSYVPCITPIILQRLTHFIQVSLQFGIPSIPHLAATSSLFPPVQLPCDSTSPFYSACLKHTHRHLSSSVRLFLRHCPHLIHQNLLVKGQSRLKSYRHQTFPKPPAQICAPLHYSWWDQRYK